MRYPKLFATLVLTASLGIHLYADLAISSIVTAAAGIATFLGTPTSANFLTAITNETGSGLVVGNDTPTIATPVLSGTVTGTYTMAGTPINLYAATSYSGTTGSNGGGLIQGIAIDGLFLQGKGSTNDFSIANAGGTTAVRIPTGTTSVVITGGLTITGVASGAAGDTDACLDATTNQVKDAGGSTCIVSSLRFKSNWHPLADDALDKVVRLQPGAFYYNNDPKKIEHVGLNAENMQAVEPRLVFYETEGPDKGKPRGVGYEETVALLVKAIQELQAQVATLKAAK